MVKGYTDEAPVLSAHSAPLFLLVLRYALQAHVLPPGRPQVLGIQGLHVPHTVSFSLCMSCRDPVQDHHPLNASSVCAVEEAVDDPSNKRRKGDEASAAAAGPAPSDPNPASPSMIPNSTYNQSSVTNNTTAAPVVPASDPSGPGRATKAWRLANGTLGQGKKQNHGPPQVDVAVSPEQAQQHQQQHQRQLQAQEQKRKLDFSTVRATPAASASQSVQQLGVCHEITTMPLVVHRTLGQSPPRAGHHSAGNGSAAGEVDFKAFRKASVATPKPPPIRLTTEDQFRAHADNDAYGRWVVFRSKICFSAPCLTDSQLGRSGCGVRLDLWLNRCFHAAFEHPQFLLVWFSVELYRCKSSPLGKQQLFRQENSEDVWTGQQ